MNNTLNRRHFIQSRLLNSGLIVASRPRLNMIRIDPPLTVSKKVIDLFMKNVQQILNNPYFNKDIQETK